METFETYLTGIADSANELINDIASSGGNVFQALSFAFNLLPYFAIAVIALLAFNACWSWRLLKPAMAFSGAVIFGFVGQFISVSVCEAVGSTTFFNIISIPGVVTAVSAIIGAVLCYYAARLFLSLAIGVDVMAIVMSFISGIAGLIVGLVLGLAAFILVIIFFKKIYVFVNSVLGMVVAGVIAGLTLTSSLEYSYVSIIAMVFGGLIGLVFGIKVFKKQFND